MTAGDFVDHPASMGDLLCASAKIAEIAPNTL